MLLLAMNLLKGGKNDFSGFGDCIIKHNKKKELAFAITAEMSTRNINPD